MKITLIALLALGLGLPLAGADKKKTDVEETGYKGRVKSVKVSKFKIEEKFGKSARTEGQILSHKKYDEKGNLLESVRYDGKIEHKYPYKNDEKGIWVEQVWDDTNGNLLP